MYHCDTLRLHFVENVFRRGWPLIGVQTGGAQDQLIAARRQLRSSRCRGNHQNAFVFIDIRRRLSGRGAQVTNDVFDAVVDHFVGYRYRLFRVASVIIFDDLQLIALDAALSVDIRYRLLCAGKLLVAVLGHRADIAPTTAILISSASAALLITKAIHPASNALPFIFILRLPHYYGFAFVVMLFISALFCLYR